MRKLLANVPAQKTELGAGLSANSILTGAQHNAPAALDRALRVPRSKSYLELISKLDAGVHHHNKTAWEELKSGIQHELPPNAFEMLIGIVSKCYLGAPYEVHTLDFFGQIIEHYKTGQSMKPDLERARNLAKHSSYICIEVYSGKLVAVAHDGQASIINC